MEITINVQSKAAAAIIVDGKSFEVKRRGFETKLCGDGQGDDTLGGMVVSDLLQLVGKVMDAMGVTKAETWKVLPERVADKVYDCF